MPDDLRCLTRQEVADQFRVSLRSLDELVKRHGIPVLRLGRSVRFDAVALEALESACRPVPPPAPVFQPRYFSTPSAPLARARKSAFEEALALTMQPSRGKKQFAK